MDEVEAREVKVDGVFISWRVQLATHRIAALRPHVPLIK